MKYISKPFSHLSGAEVYEILKARSAVFMIEQKIICLDMDDVDYNSQHCFLEENGKVLAYLRAFPELDKREAVHIGRVLSVTHGIGLGTKLMLSFINQTAKMGEYKTITLNAQKSAVPFYEKFGFKVATEEFLEQGVKHIGMELIL